ncbi:MAG: histidine kinase [Lachnospiraceae bacterium]|nr:histidine kinase [Lachnospiraceae bacterium]
MKELIGKLIIICFCLFSLFFIPLNAAFATGLFFVVAVTSLTTTYRNRRFVFILSGIYLLLTLLFPVLSVFFPVLVYDLIRERGYPLTVLTCLILICQTLPDAPQQFAFLLLGMLLSGYLSWLTRQWELLDADLIRIRDDSEERSLLLAEKNRNLIERQNQEIYTATLKERNRIAREIHDNVGHMLSRSILMVGALTAINKQENLTPSLTQLEETLHQAMNNVRVSVHDLHDDSVDLHASIEELTGSYEGCPVHLDYDMSHHIPNEIKYSFISIVKEALVNIQKHSNATQVQIRLLEHPGLYQLIIEDNGTLSDSFQIPEENDTAKQGMGLANMRNRVRSLNGSIQFQTEHGFSIFVTVPKNQREDT